MWKKLQFGGNEEEKHLFNYKITRRLCLIILDETFSIEARGIGYYSMALLPIMIFVSQLQFVNGIKMDKIYAKIFKEGSPK